MSQYATQLEINGVEDVPVVIHYEHVKFHRGSTDGRYGPKLEPDEPEHIEIDWVQGPDGQVIELTTAQEEHFEEEIGDWLQGRYDEDPPERDE